MILDNVLEGKLREAEGRLGREEVLSALAKDSRFAGDEARCDFLYDLLRCRFLWERLTVGDYLEFMGRFSGAQRSLEEQLVLKPIRVGW